MQLILIGGASGSGKTVFSEKLFALLKKNGLKVTRISMDNYFKERPDNLTMEEFTKSTNFDHPSALKLDAMLVDLLALAEGKSIQEPKFLFETNKVTGYTEVAPADIVMVEGLHALKLIPKIADKKENIETFGIFIGSSSYYTPLQRRIERDLSGDRGHRTKNEMLKRERQKVGPTFFSLICSDRSYANIELLNDGDGTEALDRIVSEAYDLFVKELTDAQNKQTQMFLS